MPLTRDRTSTSRDPAARAVYSSVIGRRPASACATPTSGGGGVMPPDAPRPQPASIRAGTRKIASRLLVLQSWLAMFLFRVDAGGKVAVGNDRAVLCRQLGSPAGTAHMRMRQIALYRLARLLQRGRRTTRRNDRRPRWRSKTMRASDALEVPARERERAEQAVEPIEEATLPRQ